MSTDDGQTADPQHASGEPSSDSPHSTVRKADAAAIKGLAHPLRLELYDQLVTFGPATSAMLAHRLNESSGATSYHLRQLARSGLIVEVQGEGTARERYWQPTPGGLALGPDDHLSPSSKQAAGSVARNVAQRASQRAEAFVDRALGHIEDPEERPWLEASELAVTRLQLTVEELAELGEEVQRILQARRLSAEQRDSTAETRRIQVQFYAFPLDAPDEGDLS
ncbi:ArsR/SmtB family transcription factor [Demequina zhanjiangensis]|uniref:Helix-turn-helix domain-containing protein n=1 Tax=Demequina zhanjiangensis TaxID=3051659 RepID=A0ABT8G344_9MICO|nr:helix-turn-helix domain-containing protein [Demequina sp. SYSU T00b26]MDN4473564.1 helix-turn-helix domain-containing protein [Demequina sp. SYSU T00b26]